MNRNVHVWLRGQSLELMKPNIPFALSIVTVCSVVLVATLIVRVRLGSLNGSSGKFKHPLKNINVIISIVLLALVLLHLGHRGLAHLGIVLYPTGTHGKQRARLTNYEAVRLHKTFLTLHKVLRFIHIEWKIKMCTTLHMCLLFYGHICRGFLRALRFFVCIFLLTNFKSGIMSMQESLVKDSSLILTIFAL